jgi:hypothetical protein
MKILLTISIIVPLFFESSCQTANSKDKIILDKNKCYADKLTSLKQAPLYNEVLSAFRDTFEVLKAKKEYFGVPEVVSNQIDEAVFFKKDSSECMLLVLQKSIYPELSFGTARTIRGSWKEKKWHFKVSKEFLFSKNYFELYKENSFENIAKLARFNVLTDGEIKKRGCEIDDEYWFIHLKN